MKNSLLCLVLSALLAVTVQCAVAQHIAYNERTPAINLKKCKWLDGNVPCKNEVTYIGFIYSRSNSCIEFCYRLKRQLDNAERPVTVILVTREPENIVEPHLRELLNDNTGVILDEEGDVFRDFGIRYVPFGVVTDSKRKAVWFGNPLTSDKNIFRDSGRSTAGSRKTTKQKNKKTKSE